MTEFTVTKITVRKPEADDGFREIRRVMFLRDIRNTRRQLEAERRRLRTARREQERRRILRKWILLACLGAVILFQVGMIAETLWRR